MSSSPESIRPCDGSIPPAEPTARPPITHAPDAGPSSSMDRRILLGLAGVAGVAALSRFARAGDLDPPAGPVSPTGVSLGQIDTKLGTSSAKLSEVSSKIGPFTQTVAEPRTPLSAVACTPGDSCLYRITQPGTYCMTENVAQVPGVVCVSIECDGVDLDGQGFSFVGAPAGSPPSSCVRASGRLDIEIYDCAFRGWQGACCDCDDCDDCYFSDILCLGCRCPADAATGAGGCCVSCRDRCEIDDVCVSLCTCDNAAVRCRDKSTVRDLSVTDCVGRACECRDACCVESVSVLSSSVLAGTSSSGMIACGDDCSCRDIEGRQCSCPQGYLTAGQRWVCEDACLSHITGQCARCADGCCIGDMECRACVGPGLTCGSGACVECVAFSGHQGDCVTVLSNACVCDVECRACTGVAITCGSGACVEEVAVSSHTGDCVRCADGSCVTEVECRSCAGLCISVGQSSLIEDCDVSGGTGAGSYRCADGSSIRRSRSMSRDQSMDIAVTDRCTVEDCTVTRGQGIRCGSNCCISSNVLSACTGGLDTTAGMGGAILVLGAHSSVEENQLTDCRVAISVRSGAHFCSVDDNHVSASVGGITGGVVAGIVVAAAVDRVMCTCNHLRVPAGAIAFSPGSSSYGPLVSVQQAGGDISLSPSSAHHLANYIVS